MTMTEHETVVIFCVYLFVAACLLAVFAGRKPRD